jgi:hypothetical protein
MEDNKMNYVYNHISTIEERMQTIKENLKWISSEVKFIKKYQNLKKISKTDSLNLSKE